MQSFEPLIPGKFYHIYNRGIDGCDLFYEKKNYEYFLKLYKKYTSLIADTYAWVLMKNHFHFLARMKEPFELQSNSITSVENKPHYQYFSNLFNAYSKSLNKKYLRHGSLMERPFKRKLIEDQNYLKEAILYINNNPVHHGISRKAEDYEWSSYKLYISENAPQLFRFVINEWFDSLDNFKFVHQHKTNPEYDDLFE